MNLVFIGPLGHAGLALAIGLGACLNAGSLLYQLKKQQVYQPQPGWTAYFSGCCWRFRSWRLTLFYTMGDATVVAGTHASSTGWCGCRCWLAAAPRCISSRSA